MTKDEIIEMAKQTGYSECHMTTEPCGKSLVFLEAFAKLVAEKEREACAKYVEECSLPDAYSQECLPDIANEIRARGQA
jgi:hypothetical protein